MNKLILLVGLISFNTFAASIPFTPELEYELDRIKAGTSLATGSVTAAKIAAGAITEADTTAQNVEGLHLKRVARVTYDVAADGGTVAAHALGVTLPAKSIITGGFLYVVTQFSDAGSGTVAIHCEDANNIKTATDITGSAAGATIAIATTPIAGIANACEVTATVASAEQTTGKLLGFIEYVVGE